LPFVIIDKNDNITALFSVNIDNVDFNNELFTYILYEEQDEKFFVKYLKDINCIKIKKIKRSTYIL